jgi:CubicO group peptidase (beta-lactamase class C family)
MAFSSIQPRTDWTVRLEELAAANGVPGASLAVIHDGEAATATTGVINLQTGVEVTADAVFSIGSITKVYVATAIMRLVEMGRVELDEPLRTQLPEFGVSDRRASERVTPRHLLCHTSGIAGDNFADTGRGDDALERFAALCRELGQDVPCGSVMSYSNTGFSLLGRLIETATGETWDDAMRALLYDPLDAHRTLTLPEDALRFRTAFGHEHGPDGRPALVEEWDMPRSSGPAGGICATASELAAFGRLHLDGGRTPTGARVLSEDSVSEMQRPQVAVPDRWTLGDCWGLGWCLRDVGGRRIFSHDGNGAGQNALLTVVPDAGTVVALVSNGGDRSPLGRVVVAELLKELCDLELPRPPQPDGARAQVNLAGRYERFGVRLELDGTPTATLSVVEPLASQLPGHEASRLELRPSSMGDSIFVARLSEDSDEWLPLVAFEVDGDRYVHFGGRAMRKVA